MIDETIFHQRIVAKLGEGRMGAMYHVIESRLSSSLISSLPFTKENSFSRVPVALRL